MEPLRLSVGLLPAPEDALAALLARPRARPDVDDPDVDDPDVHDRTSGAPLPHDLGLADLIRVPLGPPVGTAGHFAGFVDALTGPVAARADELRAAAVRLSGLPHDSSVEAFVSRVAAGTGRFDRLRTALTEYAAAGREPRRERVEPGPLVARALDQLGLTGDLDVVVSGPAIWGDADQLALLVRHLVANGVSFGQAAESGLVVRTARDGPHWVLRVVDHGPGVPASERLRVLQPMVRLDRDRTVAGDGLGLAVCQRAAESHDGAIFVNRTPGGGTSVRVLGLSR